MNRIWMLDSLLTTSIMVTIMMHQDEEYYKISEITKKYKLTRHVLYKWINEGKIQAIKLGGAIRIVKSSFDSFVHPITPGEIGPDPEEDTEE
jgi:excisionase family DNA binding protein